MPLELVPWSDADFDHYPELTWQAFQHDLMGVLYPNGFSPLDREITAKDKRVSQRKHAQESIWMKVIDTDLPASDELGGMVSAAHWHFYTRERSTAELDAESKNDAEDEEETPPGLNRAFADQFFADIEKYRRDIMGGQPYILLHMLVVRPSHQRRGIGSMHLTWGAEQADKLGGLPLYLESSPMGRRLYERHGFEQVCELPSDARAHGHEKDLPHVCMLRPGKKGSIA